MLFIFLEQDLHFSMNVYFGLFLTRNQSTFALLTKLLNFPFKFNHKRLQLRQVHLVDLPLLQRRGVEPLLDHADALIQIGQRGVRDRLTLLLRIQLAIHLAGRELPIVHCALDRGQSFVERPELKPGQRLFVSQVLNDPWIALRALDRRLIELP